MTRAVMRYRVKDASGRELVVPSLRDLHHLYAHGFLSDDDLVRSETSERWVRVGSMRALDGVREIRSERPGRMIAIVAALVTLAAAIGLLLAR
ncbi:hypothetical protein [Anaeromyxobacter oryzae]|uniref:GYF domain-containing protein n=1 Tax=Anaeromyxobacter oryzae TaxID=2918170 RepID=A0ABN6N2Y8_9BACT|nr:hypothetical protein [Anaeromyxobacter oryzae]BDG06378.1 hypothetical protein AMOR_53740 [Anaeromyxobacter oryzae]